MCRNEILVQTEETKQVGNIFLITIQIPKLDDHIMESKTKAFTSNNGPVERRRQVLASRMPNCCIHCYQYPDVVT
jgi:hypothetical protein